MNTNSVTRPPRRLDHVCRESQRPESFSRTSHTQEKKVNYGSKPAPLAAPVPRGNYLYMTPARRGDVIHGCQERPSHRIHSPVGGEVEEVQYADAAASAHMYGGWLEGFHSPIVEDTGVPEENPSRLGENIRTTHRNTPATPGLELGPKHQRAMIDLTEEAGKGCGSGGGSGGNSRGGLLSSHQETDWG
ncbi:unnamed protein product [Pleuronectes platessa]|uniref:Uncharacterized protein n=1 Tax=Pleuronectes platessa TaxID=8262 RepID=A0A9N7YMX4_PLEPL|nr:unnamed protein product [Pleuronectes platessa]